MLSPPVTPIWDMGITGKGVITALVDDGLDYNSDDLAANFVSISFLSSMQVHDLSAVCVWVI